MEAIVSSPPAWLAAGVGALVWMIGHAVLGRAAKRREHGATPPRVQSAAGHAISLAGAVAVCMSIYAGFWGPSRVGPVTVQPFPFSNSSTAARRRAADYARTHLQIDRRAALGWHGASRKSLEYAVVNQGDRSLSSIVVRFRTSPASGARAIDMILRGPFPAGKRVRTVIDVPPSVDRSFFGAVSPVENGHVIGARF